MAKRKAARAKGRKTAGTRTGAGQARSRAARAVRKTSGARKAAAKRGARKASRKAPARQAARKASTRKATRKAAAKAPARRAPARQAPARKATARTAPALNRERRIVREDELPPSPPSSLDLDRTASSARSGRRGLADRLHEHTQTGPALTGGDIDADWESAYTVGDEAPGGDNPTPDQDIVDDIGKALGVQYEDNEELKGEKKISDRDKKRWELDPASSDDYDER